MERLTLTRDTIGPVRRGHPWVYADGVTRRAPAGTPVQLCDDRGRPVAFALADDGPIAARVLARHAEPVGRLLRRRVAAAAAERPGVLPADTDAYRVVNGPGDALPGVVVDRYAHVAVLRLYSAAWLPWLDDLTAALADIPGVRTVLRRLGVRRVDGDEGMDLLAGPDLDGPVVVQEAGLRFLARPDVGQKTGLFLDQREHRRFVASVSAGASVANLFAYTGGFSVHAAAAGARHVTTVDISAPALEDARENFRLNGLDPAAHAFVAADAFGWTPDAPVDVLVCDPPNLSHGKGSDRAAAVAYRDLNKTVGAHVRQGGLLATASCTARLSRERWEQAVREGLRSAGRWSWLWRAAEPPDHPVALDHPEGRYLKFAVLRRRAG
jgi:23S rRNA (cytosine1962-C5)-methyltransferase